MPSITEAPFRGLRGLRWVGWQFGATLGHHGKYFKVLTESWRVSLSFIINNTNKISYWHYFNTKTHTKQLECSFPIYSSWDCQHSGILRFNVSTSSRENTFALLSTIKDHRSRAQREKHAWFISFQDPSDPEQPAPCSQLTNVTECNNAGPFSFQKTSSLQELVSHQLPNKRNQLWGKKKSKFWVDCENILYTFKFLLICPACDVSSLDSQK